MRILVAFEADYRTYRDVIAAGISILRPHVEVETTSLEALADGIERLDPRLVICSRPNTVDPGGRPAWVELTIDPTRLARVCVGGRCSERINPTVDVLLAIIDEVEELIQTKNVCRGC
jgi:hypothetical protein